MPRAREGLCLALALVCVQLAAQEPESPKPLSASRLRSPVTVTADRAQWQREGSMVYSGNVALNSADLDLEGDQLELVQTGAGAYEARIDGNPARLRHAAAGAEPAMAARARTIVYDSRTGIVQLNGGVHLDRGADVLTSDSLRYDINARRVEAASGDTGRVRIVIQPPPESGKRAAEPPPPPSP